MAPEELTFRSVADDRSLIDGIEAVVELVWPTFIREGRHNPAARYEGDYPGLYDRWPEYQYAIQDASGMVVAGVHCCPLAWDDDENTLPDDGWDWELQSAAEDKKAGAIPHTLGAVSISIHPALRGRHLSSELLLFMKQLGKRAGLTRLIAPVRPTRKSENPFLSMEEYLTHVTDEGLSSDPWLRTHQRIGGRIVRPCNCSMQLVGSVDEWRRWTGAALETSGAHAIPAGLVPLQVTLENNLATYIEPNVWVVHDIA